MSHGKAAESNAGRAERSSRSRQVRIQIVYSVLVKGISVILGLLLIPLLIDTLNPQRYAVWLTLSSIFSWFSFFDFGLGNGLRNKLTEALAVKDNTLAREYVSTTYAFVSAVFLLLLIAFLVVNPFFNWNWALHVDKISANELYILTTVACSLFLLRFIFQLIGTIYIAAQRPAMNNVVVVSGNVLAFLSILIARYFSVKSLPIYGGLLIGFPLMTFVVANFLSFRGKFHHIRPSLKMVKLQHGKALLNLGGMFFIVQVGAMVLFSTYNVVISHLFNAEEVVVFGAAFTYFQLPVVGYSIIMAPIWSAVTDAYAKSDFQWLHASLKKLNALSAMFLVGIVFMVIASPWVYEVWLGKRIEIPMIVTVSMALFAMINVVLAPYTNFINGTGKIAVTVVVVIVSLFVYFPLAFFLARTLNSSAGIMFATCLVNGVGLYLQPKQVKKILSGNAAGLWNR
jgi:O-antigen/teichoic acid export membrane protein